MTEQFIGAGWAFPVSTDATGRIALVTRDREIEEAIRLVLGTSPGERPMRPEFGCRVHERVFDVANAAIAGQISYDVRTALDRWEPRIEVQEVTVTFDPDEMGTLYIDVRYALRGTNNPRNLVFPFYVIPDHEPVVAVAPRELRAVEASPYSALISAMTSDLQPAGSR